MRIAADALVHAAGMFNADAGVRLLTYAWYYMARDLASAIPAQASLHPKLAFRQALCSAHRVQTCRTCRAFP